jgi:hypothetical protein
MSASSTISGPAKAVSLPGHDGLYYGGAWHAPMTGLHKETHNPATGQVLGRAADGSPRPTPIRSPPQCSRHSPRRAFRRSTIRTAS